MSIINDVIGITFLIAVIVIYIPQFVKLYQKKTSHGFSPWFMFLGHTASFWTCANTLVYYINGWWDCHGTTNCSENFIGFALVVAQWILYFIMYIFYLLYLPDSKELYYPKYRKYCRLTKRQFVNLTFTISIILSAAALIANLFLLNKYHWHDPSSGAPDLVASTSAIEILILIFFLIHYFPQIYETYRIKEAGSISLVTLALMCPGTFGWTLYLALQGKIGPNSQAGNPMVWVPYLIVGLMQAVLLGMGVYYERQKRRNLYHLLIDEDEVKNQQQVQVVVWDD